MTEPKGMAGIEEQSRRPIVADSRLPAQPHRCHWSGRLTRVAVTQPGSVPGLPVTGLAAEPTFNAKCAAHVLNDRYPINCFAGERPLPILAGDGFGSIPAVGRCPH